MKILDHKTRKLSTNDWFGSKVCIIGPKETTFKLLKRMRECIVYEGEDPRDYQISCFTKIHKDEYDQIIFVTDTTISDDDIRFASSIARRIMIMNFSEANGLCLSQSMLNNSDWLVIRELEKLLPEDHPLRVERNKLRQQVDEELGLIEVSDDEE